MLLVFFRFFLLTHPCVCPEKYAWVVVCERVAEMFATCATTHRTKLTHSRPQSDQENKTTKKCNTLEWNEEK